MKKIITAGILCLCIAVASISVIAVEPTTVAGPSINATYNDGTVYPVGQASLSLASDIAMRFYLTRDTEGYMTAGLDGATAENLEKDSTGRVFSYYGIYPSRIGDKILADLWENNASVAGAKYSVQDYCLDMLANSNDQALKTLCADLLNYGAAAQKYVGYNVDNLVNTDEKVASNASTVFNPVASALNINNNGVLTWDAANLSLKSNVVVKAFFNADSIEGMTAKVSYKNGTEVDLEIVDLGYRYALSFDGLAANDFDEVLTFTVTNKDGASATLTYSIDTYITRTLANSSASNELKDLCTALGKYIVSANNYTPAA